MSKYEVLEIISSLYPILIGLFTLVFILSKIYVDVETLKSQVIKLFDFHNDSEKKK
jgi:hypothetical protein|tara:strand:+ start:356 stop:523 length:168 start_codon:yes stop_codon:yes gene_type:complete